MSKTVHDMFSSIANSYDRANDFLSFGIHRLWRKNSLNLVPINKDLPIYALDICCGTGDYSGAIMDAAHFESKIVGLDFVFPMLNLAKEKFPFKRSRSLARGDALCLPFRENTFDLCTIGFGIRNVDSVEESLDEIKRVLKAGGRVLVLEFGQPYFKPFRFIYNIYSKYVMPYLGGFITGNKSAYEYLPETSALFPCGEDFLNLMQKKGFKNASYKPYFFGIAYAYVGSK